MSARDREERILGDLLRALDRTPTGAKEPTHPSPPWRVDGIDVGPDDRNDATVLGMELKMLHAIDMRNGTWFAQRLLGPGRECVREYGGDVGEWRAAQQAAQGGIYYDQRTWINQRDHGQAVAYSRDVEQRVDEAP